MSDDMSMGEYEEHFAYECDPPDDLITRNSLWRTMGGKLIRIRDMTDSHLLNAVRVLRGMSPIGTRHNAKPARRRMWLNAMANEAYDRGLQLDELTKQEPVHE